MLSEIIRGRVTSCCFPGQTIGSARGLCGAASDSAGFCATIIKRRHDAASAGSVFWPYEIVMLHSLQPAQFPARARPALTTIAETFAAFLALTTSSHATPRAEDQFHDAWGAMTKQLEKDVKASNPDVVEIKLAGNTLILGTRTPPHRKRLAGNGNRS
jgi:hypothetical protein